MKVYELSSNESKTFYCPPYKDILIYGTIGGEISFNMVHHMHPSAQTVAIKGSYVTAQSVDDSHVSITTPNSSAVYVLTSI